MNASFWPGRLLGTAAMAALLLAPLSCSPGDKDEGPSDGGGESSLVGKDLNVLLIVIDTLAARHLGCYTPGLTCSPTIDRLAREGVFFRRAYSPAPWTQPAVASLFTSLMPSEAGMTQIFHTLADSLATLPELMRERGRWTMGVTSNWIVVDRFGFGQGFEKLIDSPVGDHKAITSDKVTEMAELVLDRAGRRPFFLYVHYFDPHWYFNHHPRFDRTSGYAGRLTAGMEIGEIRRLSPTLSEEDLAYLEGLYREEIAFTDEQVGRLLDHLEALGLAGNTLVILTADHGEEFREHGWIGHTANLYDNLLHVPLVFQLPGRLAPRVVDAPASLLDVMPTLAALTGSPTTGARWRGVSLADCLEGRGGPAEDRPLYAEVSFTSPDGWPTGDDQVKSFFLTAVRRGRWKVIHDLQARTWALYDLAVDPQERNGDRESTAAAAGELGEMLRQWEEARGEGPTEAPAELDAEAVERLRSLGYVH